MIAAKVSFLLLIFCWALGSSEEDKNLNIFKQKFFNRLTDKFENNAKMSDADRKTVIEGFRKMLNEKPVRKRRKKQYQHLNWKPNIGQWDFSGLKNIFG